MSIQLPLVVLSGPSGGGKSSLIHEISRSDNRIHIPISFTTRKPYKGEVNGMDYYFVSRKRFKEMRDAGEFLESAMVHGEYYGTPISILRERKSPGVIKLLDVDCNGALQIKKLFPETVINFVSPPRPVIPTLRKRMKARGRGETPRKIQQRLKTAEEELQHINDFDCIIVNADGQFPDALKEAKKILHEVRLGNRPGLLRFHNPTLISQIITA